MEEFQAFFLTLNFEFVSLDEHQLVREHKHLLGHSHLHLPYESMKCSLEKDAAEDWVVQMAWWLW